MAAQKAKRHVRRPKMKRQPDVVLISPVEEVEVEEPVATQPPTEKSRCGGSYSRWGNPNLWPLIAQVVALHPQSLTDALNHLQHDMREKIGLMATKKAAQERRNTEKPRGIFKDHPETAN